MTSPILYNCNFEYSAFYSVFVTVKTVFKSTGNIANNSIQIICLMNNSDERDDGSKYSRYLKVVQILHCLAYKLAEIMIFQLPDLYRVT
jgi:hypothetical protein